MTVSIEDMASKIKWILPEFIKINMNTLMMKGASLPYSFN